MTTQNPFIPTEVAAENSFAQFNAFESAAPSALKEFPVFVPDSRSTASDSLTPPVALYDSTQRQPFEITDEQGRVIAADNSTLFRTEGEAASTLDDQNKGCGCGGGCSGCGCGCSEYTVKGWNRSSSVAQNRFSSCDDGSCDDDDGDGYDPGDDYEPDDDYPEDEGDCGPGGGLLRGLLARFGRGGLFGRLFGSGGMGFGRFLR